MRRSALLLALPMMLAFGLLPATAQHWNEGGPGRDLLSGTMGEMDGFRQRVPVTPDMGDGTTMMAAQGRPAIPMLDWTPPPMSAAPSTYSSGVGSSRRSSATVTRRVVRRPVQASMRRETMRRDSLPADPRPMPAAASGGDDWERRMAERERDLERLRRQLEEDRLRYQQARQPQLR